MLLPDHVAPIVGNNLYKIRQAQHVSRTSLAARCAQLRTLVRFRDVLSPLTPGALMHLEFGRRIAITTAEVQLLAAALAVPAATLTTATRIVAPFDDARRRSRPSAPLRHPKIEIVRRKAVAAMLGISNSTLGRWIRAGEFPAGLQLGRNSVGWERSMLRDWLAMQPRKETMARR